MNNNHQLFQFNQITDLIYLGTNLCCNNLTHMRILLDHKIKADIDLEEGRQEETLGVETYLWLPVIDKQAPSRTQLKVGVAVLENLIKDGKKVYVHCKNGHGRSPTLVAAYYVSQGLGVDDAISKVREKRPEIHLEKVQIAALKGYQKSLQS